MAQPAHVATPPAVRATAGHEHLAWRRWVPWVLVVLAAVIGLVSALNIWVKRQALDSNNWANASSQLLRNDEIRAALSTYLVNEVYRNVDVRQRLEQRLPPQTRALAPPLAAALQTVSIRAADELLSRPRVQRLWEQANLRAHQLFMAVLEGDEGILVSSGGNVVLNLQPLVAQLADETGIGTRVAQRLPPDAGKIVVMKGNQLETARKAIKVVKVLSYLLFFLVLALYAVAVFLARGRRRAVLMGSGVSVLVVGLLVLVVRRYAGNYLVDALTTNQDAEGAVGAAWAIGTQLLRNTGLNAVIYGLGIVFAAWIAGPSRPATWSRRVSAPTMRDHPVVVYGVVALALFLVLLAGPTDAQRIFPLLILFALAFAGTEVLRRQTAREFATPVPQAAVSAEPAVPARSRGNSDRVLGRQD